MKALQDGRIICGNLFKGVIKLLNENKETVIKILSKDRTGLIYEITKVFYDLNIGILNHSAKVYNDRNKRIVSECQMTIFSENYDIVTLAKRRLQHIKNVISVQ